MGGSPKAPPPPPDPAIAAEKARREGIAIALADMRSSSRYGSTGANISAGGVQRPTENPALYDLGDTKVAVTNKKIADLKAQPLEKATSYSGEGGDSGNTTSYFGGGESQRDRDKKVTKLSESITPADRIAYDSLKKENAIAQYTARARKRLGVQQTVGAAT